jgi:DNA-binding MarR family transcriptional regulator
MPTEKTNDREASMLDLYQHPGHLLRRAQQISVSIFYDEMGAELTPVQYAILSRLAEHPGIDQVSLAGLAAIDTSTGATVCARLEEKGLLERKVIPHNRRQRALSITADGARPAAARAAAGAFERAGAGPVHGLARQAGQREQCAEPGAAGDAVGSFARADMTRTSRVGTACPPCAGTINRRPGP